MKVSHYLGPSNSLITTISGPHVPIAVLVLARGIRNEQLKFNARGSMLDRDSARALQVTD
jgi:hypothetical protein